MARAGAGKHWTGRGHGPIAGKGRDASKRAIARCYHHGQPDVEERSIERTVRQDGKKEIARALVEVDPAVAAPVERNMAQIGIPYARQEMDKKGRIFAICPACKQKIPLTTPKDEESMSNEPYAKHWAERHAQEEDEKSPPKS